MEKVTSLSLARPTWVFETITKNENVLTLGRAYFRMTGGLDRALYRVRSFIKGGEDAEKIATELSRLDRTTRQDARAALIESGKNPRLADAD